MTRKLVQGSNFKIQREGQTVAQASSLCRLGCAPNPILCTENMVIDAQWAPRRLSSVLKPIKGTRKIFSARSGRESEAPPAFRIQAISRFTGGRRAPGRTQGSPLRGQEGPARLNANFYKNSLYPAGARTGPLIKSPSPPSGERVYRPGT